MRFVYVGITFAGSTTRSRGEALQALGHHAHVIDGFPPESRAERWLYGARRRLGFGWKHPVNRAVLDAFAGAPYDSLWVDKGLNVAVSTLAAVRRKHPRIFLIHYSPDDFQIRGNVTPDLLRGLALYDLVVTTKTHNLDYLRGLGARNVFMSWQGYDELLHRPPDPADVDSSLRDRILFIGAWEKERAATIESLLRAGLPVTVMSSWAQWRPLAERFTNLDWRPRDVFGKGYGVALGSAAIGLGFLRKQARDQHTTRSLEIPACGSVLVAERTSEHLQLFDEGKEAFFFSSDEECIEICKRLLAEPSLRTAVAAAGRQRCLSNGYSWRERVRQIVDEARRLGAPAS